MSSKISILIIDDNDEFTFLDWRQSFNDWLVYGDIYYDLAKLNHGITISHELISKNLFTHKMVNHVITFDFLRKNVMVEIQHQFENFVRSLTKHYHTDISYRKVQYLTHFISANIASLHHYPYSLMLFHSGKLGLWQLLEQDNNE